ncbi:MAG TPA: MFS transporter, partial [Candidatus Acidoferrales bacterium]|nr:MFS transporter [Candidatus Acidoferrales bacterium]
MRSGQTPPTQPARLVLLLALGMFINYVDRGNLSTVGPVLQDQLHLSSTELGSLFSAFFVTYVVGMVPGGWLADRFGAKRVLGVGAAIWSTATLLTGLAGSFISVLSLRLVLGVGETAAFPSISKVLATSIERTHIGLANGVIGCAYLIGPAVGTAFGGILLAHLGWRAVFIILGGLSLLWLAPWSRVVLAENGPPLTETTGAVPGFPQILRQRGLWGAALGSFAGSYGYYAMLSWLPTYLVKARGLSIESMTAIAASGFAINAISALLFGWAIDRWVRSGHSPTMAWKVPMGLGSAAGIVATIGFAILPIHGCIGCLCLFMVLSGCTSVGYFAIPQLLAGPGAAARFVGISNMSGNVAGIVAPLLTGVLVDASGAYWPAFVLIALVYVLGVVGWVIVLPRVEPIRWAA